MDEEALADIMERLGEEIVNSRQVEHVMEQAEIEGGNLNLEYYMQLDLSENQYVSRAITAIREDFARKLSFFLTSPKKASIFKGLQRTVSQR